MKGTKNILSIFPENEYLLTRYALNPDTSIPDINGHIHTPYSFSAFNSIGQAVRMAKEEKVKILGINDFFVTDGYDEFYRTCLKHKIFPLFNIEFIGLNKEDQTQNLKVNDPSNPGRTYLSGKGLDYPPVQSVLNRRKLEAVIDASQEQIVLMLEKLNPLLKNCGIDQPFTFEGIGSKYAKNLVRERHLATALRVLAEDTFVGQSERIKFYEELFNSPLTVDIYNAASLENEIRSRLLKLGGAAFVPEEESSFLPVEELCEIILDAGGIPTYPLLLDDAKGNFTDFEADREKLHEKLVKYNIHSVEFIPGRNALHHLEDYATYLYNKGYLVTFGTEHNTPSLDPIKVTCRARVDLSDNLKKIAFESTSVLAAHQYLKARGEKGYPEQVAKKGMQVRQEFIELGKAVLQYYFNL